MMRALLAALLLTCILPAAAAAQPGEAPAETREAMARLSFLVGSWAGDAWMQTGPGPRTDITQTEAVTAHLDGLVLVVAGEGRLKSNPETIVHQAFATIAWDANAKHYRVQAVRKDGNSVDAVGEFGKDGNFRWGFDMRGGKVRYTIQHTDDDGWLETGEFSANGTDWQQFLEMRLTRLK